MSSLVRKELLVLISCLVKEWRGCFIVCAWIYWEEDRKRGLEGLNLFHHDDNITAQVINGWLDAFKDDDEGNSKEENRAVLSSGFTMVSILLELSVNLYQEVATNAQTNVDYIVVLLESAFARLKGSQFLNQMDRSSTTKFYLGCPLPVFPRAHSCFWLLSCQGLRDPHSAGAIP